MQSASGLLRPVWRGAVRARQDVRNCAIRPAPRPDSAIDATPDHRAPFVANAASSLPADQTVRAAQFEELFLPLLDDAFNFARWLTRNRDDAEDIVQEAYLRALRFFDAERSSNPRAWILSIVRNTFYTSIAKKRARPEVSLTEPFPRDDLDADAEVELWDPHQDSPETALARKSEGEAIRALVEALPPSFRETVILREMEGFSYQEIADITDVPIGTVMSRLSRARGLLAAAWKRFEGKEGGR
jgi:RNA polymerase sigma-70 factor (ECF subfamily)